MAVLKNIGASGEKMKISDFIKSIKVSPVAAGFLAVLWAFVREAGERAKSDPEQSKRIQALRDYLRLR